MQTCVSGSQWFTGDCTLSLNQKNDDNVYTQVNSFFNILIKPKALW